MELQIGLQQPILSIVQRGEALHGLQAADPLICQIAVGRMRCMAGAAGRGVEVAAVVPDFGNVRVQTFLGDPHREAAREPLQLGRRILNGLLARDLRDCRRAEGSHQYPLSFHRIECSFRPVLLPAIDLHLQPIAISRHYRELCRHGGILSDFFASWYPRQVTAVQHGVGERGYKSVVTGEPVPLWFVVAL